MTLYPAPPRRPLAGVGLFVSLLLALVLVGCETMKAKAVRTTAAAVVAVEGEADKIDAAVAALEKAIPAGEAMLAKVDGETAAKIRESLEKARAALPTLEKKGEELKVALGEAKAAAEAALELPDDAPWQDGVAGYLGMAKGFTVLLPPQYRGAAELAMWAAGGLLLWSRSKWKTGLQRTVASVDATLVRSAAAPSIIASPETAKKVMATVQGPEVQKLVDKLRVKGAGKAVA